MRDAGGMTQAAHLPLHTNPDQWIALIFSAKSAQGGVVRRSIAWVEREVGRDRFIAEVRSRGFHLLASRNQFIVVCNRDPVHMLF